MLALRIKKIIAGLCLSALVMLSGCASNPSADSRDPIEGFNRAMFGFNEGLDRMVFKPIAKGYDTVVPEPIDKGVTNFFGNIEDFVTVINDLLQFKFKQGGSDAMRVLFNSTFGLLGIFDIATSMGFEKHEEDFGQTLGRWGVGDGFYLVLPVLGPSNLRDTVGLVVDNSTFDPIYHIDHIPSRNSLIVVEAVDNRAALLGASNVLEKAAPDRYDFLKETYLQNRRNAVKDQENGFGDLAPPE